SCGALPAAGCSAHWPDRCNRPGRSPPRPAAPCAATASTLPSTCTRGRGGWRWPKICGATGFSASPGRNGKEGLTSKPLRTVKTLKRRLLDRRARRARNSSQTSGTELLFETLEPRLLLAADPVALAAADTTPPTVSLTQPAAIVSGTVSLAATASDDIGV